ncbi:uncharacterized protein K444DRAFT_308480 [Hyaloscypha bicolor E]|uniref:DUF6590 domain-containing protein n=1 Tax=Hyaloscypha bicolor E TaxID=1095630 RepID=A0A2J6TMN3_9HELO|nr:uncharacterized protein K444DRAFT_308480 [Hyaloscypha bicolor E]PMD64281.1 hypothetical protein K444DRAFT_308480 [Hyaloscypha bicolor E]
MSSKTKNRRGQNRRGRNIGPGWLWDDARQKHYYADDQKRCWFFDDGTTIPYEQEVTQPLDSRVPRSAVDNHYRSDDDGNDLNSQFAELDVSQDYQDSEYIEGYKSPAHEHHEPHYTSRTQRSDNYGEAQYDSAAQGPATKSQSGLLWGSQQTPYEAPYSPYPSTSIPIPPYGAQQNLITYHARPQYSSDAQQPYSNTQRVPYSLTEADVFFDPPHNITDPRLYKKDITALARVYGIELSKCAVLGTVFKIPWSESSGIDSDRDEVEGDYGFPFRWFVVVLGTGGTRFCSCLLITTYQGWGIQKAGIAVDAHEVIGTRQDLCEDEKLGQPIIVKPKVYDSRMPYNSLVNFEKIYSIDRDVCVVEFGKVDRYQSHSLFETLVRIWSTVTANLSEEERQRRQVEDRNRWERNQDDFADG